MESEVAETDARQAVIAAADKLFYAHGIQAVGMDAVRAEAGVSLKRIYALFTSKDELAVAVLAHRAQVWSDGITESAAGATTPQQKLLAIFDFLDAWFREGDFRGCAFINAYGELGTGSVGVAEAVRQQKRDFRHYAVGLARNAGLPDAVGAQIAILAEGAQVSAAILGDPEIAAQARSAAQALIDSAR